VILDRAVDRVGPGLDRVPNPAKTQVDRVGPGGPGSIQNLSRAWACAQETKSANKGISTRSTRSTASRDAFDLRIHWTGLGPGSPVQALDLTTMEINMTDEDAERLARSAKERIEAQVQAAKRRMELQRDTRAEFAANRTAGLRSRYAAKQARMRLAARHQDGQSR